MDGCACVMRFLWLTIPFKIQQHGKRAGRWKVRLWTLFVSQALVLLIFLFLFFSPFPCICLPFGKTGVKAHLYTVCMCNSTPAVDMGVLDFLSFYVTSFLYKCGKQFQGTCKDKRTEGLKLISVYIHAEQKWIHTEICINLVRSHHIPDLPFVVDIMHLKLESNDNESHNLHIIQPKL